MTIDELTKARNAAHAAWVAATGQAKARAESALAEAQRTLAAAKRAAAPTPAPMGKAEIDAAVARNRAAFEAREAEAALQRRLDRAAALYQRASEYPRCMQGWPSTPAECAADALLRQHPERSEHLLGF
jgi:hypothetical protein